MAIYSIGLGSGILSLPVGLKPGDIVNINAGTYPGINVSGLTGVTFLPVGGTVTFTSSIILGKTENIIFDGSGLAGVKYGFIYGGTGTVFNHGGGNNVNDLFKAFSIAKTVSNIFDGSGNAITYTGTPQTALYYGLTVDTFAFGGPTLLYNGTWESPLTYHNVNIDSLFSNIIVTNDGTGSGTKVFGNSIYALRAYNWTVTGPTLTNNGDLGIFEILSGNSWLANIYRSGGWGYIQRLFQVVLGGLLFTNQDSYIYNVIDVNTVHYGTVDVRIDTSLLNSKATIPLTGGNFFFLNNDSGDKTDDGTYVTNAVVLGAMVDDQGKMYTATIQNNFAWNAMATTQSGGSSLLKNNSNGQALIVESNNIDLIPGVPLPSGYLIDKINFVPSVGSLLIGKGTSESIVIVDIYGKPRTNPPDIGAVQSVPLKQRTVVSFVGSSGKTTFTYDDGSTSQI
jgi:hypothetical protein